MKKVLLNKKNLYIKLTAVLILLIVGILGLYGICSENCDRSVF